MTTTTEPEPEFPIAEFDLTTTPLDIVEENLLAFIERRNWDFDVTVELNHYEASNQSEVVVWTAPGGFCYTTLRQEIEKYGFAFEFAHHSGRKIGVFFTRNE